jgi:hypothetical protein
MEEKSNTALGAPDTNQLIASAIEHQIPVESMERLLAMRAQLRDEAARSAFAAALAGFQSSLPPIPKSQTAHIVSQRGKFSYHYADLADIQRAIAGPLHDNGLAVTFETEERGGNLDVICTVHHIGGHSLSARFPVPVDRGARMNAAQQVGAALTYGRRYALTAALGIVTADEDTDAQGAPERQPTAAPIPNTDELREKVKARIKELSLVEHTERITNWMQAKWGISALGQCSAKQLSELLQRLPDFAERIAIEMEEAA